MDTITGYCVKCKSKGVELENAKIHKTPNIWLKGNTPAGLRYVC